MLRTVLESDMVVTPEMLAVLAVEDVTVENVGNRTRAILRSVLLNVSSFHKLSGNLSQSQSIFIQHMNNSDYLLAFFCLEEAIVLSSKILLLFERKRLSLLLFLLDLTQMSLEITLKLADLFLRHSLLSNLSQLVPESISSSDIPLLDDLCPLFGGKASKRCSSLLLEQDQLFAAQILSNLSKENDCSIPLARRVFELFQNLAHPGILFLRCHLLILEEESSGSEKEHIVHHVHGSSSFYRLM